MKILEKCDDALLLTLAAATAITAAVAIPATLIARMLSAFLSVLALLVDSVTDAAVVPVRPPVTAEGSMP